MQLYDRLLKREAQQNLIKIGLVGCGQMGSGMVHVTQQVPGMVTAAIADIAPQRAIEEFITLGIAEADIVVTNLVGPAQDALAQGKFLVTEDALLLTRLPGIGAVVEATGNTEIGAQVAWDGINHHKAVVMLNVETDVTVGPILHHTAQRMGSVYSVAAGDEPGVCKMLYDFARLCSFEVVCLGKGKNNPLDYAADPDNCAEEAARKNMNPRMLASFKDGTKTMVEMAAVCNATGLLPDVPGMYGPKVDLPELNQVFIPWADGGIFESVGRVDYSTGAIAPGVFAIVTSPDAAIRSDMQFLSMGSGPYYTLLRPYHLCNLETPTAVAEAVEYGEYTSASKQMLAEVVAFAKRDLKAGETLSGIGSADFFSKVYVYTEARQARAIPMGLAPNGRVLQDVGKGEMLTQDNLAPDTSKFVYKLRQLQDAQSFDV
jgi:predicted homoserine dehydrogenase-like protein